LLIGNSSSVSTLYSYVNIGKRIEGGRIYDNTFNASLLTPGGDTPN
jgi:hypothetical protein